MEERKEIDPNGVGQHDPGAKLDSGKIEAGLLEQFSLSLLAVAEVLTYGKNKYSEGGWQYVEDGEKRYKNAGWRHRLEGFSEERDRESGLLHKAHEAWNVLAELEFKLRKEQK